MAIRVEAVELSRNPVAVKESFIIRVAIVTNGYLGKFANAKLAEYTNGQLRLRGETVSIYKQLSAYRQLTLQKMTHQQIESMEV